MYWLHMMRFVRLLLYRMIADNIEAMKNYDVADTVVLGGKR